MIGVFDSGVGGLTAVREIRLIDKYADVAFYPDRKNAPYGTKSAEELIPLVERDIKLLLDRGADAVLMACCTASTVYPFIDSALKRAAIPIIKPTASAAVAATENGRIAVLATDATVRSGAFLAAIGEISSCAVFEIAARELVFAIENGARDGSLGAPDEELLEGYLNRVRLSGADTLILGCTHFPHLEGEISRRLPRVNIISSSREGAIEAVKESRRRGNGKTIYMG